MHERLVYGLFAPFPTMLTPTSCLYHSFFSHGILKLVKLKQWGREGCPHSV